jgi:hypothetical protein
VTSPRKDAGDYPAWATRPGRRNPSILIDDGSVSEYFIFLKHYGVILFD